MMWQIWTFPCHRTATSYIWQPLLEVQHKTLHYWLHKSSVIAKTTRIVSNSLVDMIPNHSGPILNKNKFKKFLEIWTVTCAYQNFYCKFMVLDVKFLHRM